MTADQERRDPRESGETDSTHRAGFVGLVGKPNVGKSTILNTLLGRKISIASPRPQTTRHRILGILTKPQAQVIFVDSPGWHKPLHPFGRYLIAVAKGVCEEVDIIVTVIDATSGVTREDEWVFEYVQRTQRPAILAINKTDAVKKPLILPLIEQCAGLKLFEEHIPISAMTGENMDVLLAQLIARLPEGPRWYEADQVTDQTTGQVIREFIREAILLATRQEVPHAVAVLLDEVTSADPPASRSSLHTPNAAGQAGAHANPLTRIRATILVEREGQKAIVIGKQGRMLKQIGTACRVELERWLGQRVFLELWVKVAKDWRKNPAMLRELGYQHSETFHAPS